MGVVYYVCTYGIQADEAQDAGREVWLSLLGCQ